MTTEQNIWKETAKDSDTFSLFTPKPGTQHFPPEGEKASWLLRLLREQRVDGMRAQAKISRYPGQSLILSRSKLLFNEGLLYVKPCAKHAIYTMALICPFSAQQPELVFF